MAVVVERLFALSDATDFTSVRCELDDRAEQGIPQESNVA